MFTCQVCGWATNSGAEMAGHMSRHSNRKFISFKVINIGLWS
jgi:hypothetical protein